MDENISDTSNVHLKMDATNIRTKIGFIRTKMDENISDTSNVHLKMDATNNSGNYYLLFS